MLCATWYYGILHCSVFTAAQGYWKVDERRKEGEEEEKEEPRAIFF